MKIVHLMTQQITYVYCTMLLKIETLKIVRQGYMVYTAVGDQGQAKGELSPHTCGDQKMSKSCHPEHPVKAVQTHPLDPTNLERFTLFTKQGACTLVKNVLTLLELD